MAKPVTSRNYYYLRLGYYQERSKCIPEYNYVYLEGRLVNNDVKTLMV